MRERCSKLLVGVICFAFVAWETAAENWVQWRGPSADGRAGENAKPPLQWSQNSNIAWTIPLEGEGSATPIVYGNQVIVLSAVKTNRKSATAIVNDERAKTVPDAHVYQFLVTSVDRYSGKKLWEKTVIEQVPHEGKHETNTYAAGSPITDGDHLYFSFGSRGVFCYSLQGDKIWEVDLGDMRTRSGWGEAVTPALTDDSLIINWDQEEGSFIIALDKKTGETRWKKERPGEVTSWNTPFVTTYQGKQQIIVNGTGTVKSYDAKDGTLLWECGGQTTNAIPSPIRFRDSVICMSGYRGSLACSIPLQSRGDVTESSAIDWKVTQGTPYVPSPIISGTRLLFTAGNTSVLSGLDAVSGKSLFERKRLPALKSMYASPIHANGHYYFTSREGTTVVLKDNESLDVVAVNALDDLIDASPVAVDHQLFLRSWSKLYCIQATQQKREEDAKATSVKSQHLGIAFEQRDLESTADTSANVSLGDLDGDGDLDMILAKGRHWPLPNRVLMNDGNGTFLFSQTLGEQPDRTYSAALGDLDRDGDLDVVVSNDSPDIKKVFHNDGQGHFSFVGSWGEPSWNTRNTCLSDVNDDGYLDLIVANRKSVSYVIFNDQQGKFQQVNKVAIAAESATTIVPADFDGDGHIDLAVPHRDGGVSQVLFNDGKGGFLKTVTFGPKVCSARACAAGDVNGDGEIDIVIGDDIQGTMVCLNEGKGRFGNAVPLDVEKRMPYALAIADLNQDGKNDVVVGYAKGMSRLFINEGSGLAYAEMTFGDGEGAVYGISLGDVNADGRIDIVEGRSEATNTLFFNVKK